mmetsp:Transcript_9576/g.15457  ORF Transcript_9576/g.15457 Transcript_9576/m.15457 type:complete len:122 (+) Transcript_9576:362-727(+)
MSQACDEFLETRLVRSSFSSIADKSDVFETKMAKEDCQWTGVLGWSSDNLPWVGRRTEKEWVCAGFSGHGLPRTLLSGQAIAELLTGHKFGSDHALLPPEFAPTEKRLSHSNLKSWDGAGD